MKKDIRSKLQDELNKSMAGESQVVYILSRIRKLLEIEKNGHQYPVLKFYCNWALHTEIQDTRAVRDLLKRMIASDDAAHKDFVTFKPLHDELKRFFADYGLTAEIYRAEESQVRFDRLLAEVYTDTPLVLQDRTKKTQTKVSFVATPQHEQYYGKLKF